MNDGDRSFIVRVVSYLAAFIIVSIVGGFVTARVMGLPVDVDKFYSLIGPPFFTIIGALVGVFGNKTPPKD